MPIDTRLDGRPDQLRATARWLRHQLGFEVQASVSSLRSAHTDAVAGWQGSAGAAFQTRMITNADRAQNLHGGTTGIADGLNRYADHLATAQGHMARAREIAAGANLPLDGQTILEPGAAPVVRGLPLGTTATPAMLTAQNDAMTAAAKHRQQVDAYNLAQAEAQKGRATMGLGDEFLKNVSDDLHQKWHLMLCDFVNGGVYGGVMAKRVADVRKSSDAAKYASTRHVNEYLKAPGGSPAAVTANNAAYAKFMEAQKLDVRATSAARRAGSRIPLIGLGITAAGIGYDIGHGKPVAKAVISGVGGATGAVVAGMIVGSVLAGPAGTVLGAAAGAVVGTAVSAGLDMAYDHREEIADFVGDRVDDVTGQVTEHVKAVGRSLDDTGEAIGEAGTAINDGAKKVFNAIF